MNTRSIVAVLVMVAAVASPVADAQAGGGGLGLGGTVVFQCYTIQQGVTPPHALEADDPLSPLQPVRLGKAKMVCALADASVLNNEPLNGVLFGDHFVCYETLGPQATTSEVGLIDPLAQQTVKVGQSRFFCAAADRVETP
jgi:hypothetical protein